MTDIPTKRCTKCGRELPATAEYFAMRQSTSKRILNRRCRDCLRAYRLVYQQTPEYKAKHKSHMELPEVKAHKQAYDHLPEQKAKRKQYRQTSGYKALKKGYSKLPNYKAAARRYWQKPEVKAAVNTRNHSPEFKAYLKSYSQSPEGRAKLIARTNRRRARQRDLPATFTAQDWQRALDYFGGCCAVCGRPQGLWHTLAQDHWIPLSKGGAYTPDNIVPLCHGEGGCNNSKNDRDAAEWLTERFGARKAAAILKRIDSYFAAVSL